jgi:PhnB protein
VTIKNATPYLFFRGDAAEAIALYEQALGAKVEVVQHFREVPGEEIPPEWAERVMHATLRLGETRIMLSDLPPDQSPSSGCRVEISLEFDDGEEMSRCFQALSAGGRVRSEVADVFWGGKFGTLVDRFGIEWMFSSP